MFDPQFINPHDPEQHDPPPVPQAAEGKTLRHFDDVPLAWTNGPNALQYLSMGLCPIPIKPESKAPAMRAWKHLQDQLPTEADVIEWYTLRWPRAGVGLVAGQHSNTAVLDVDPRNGGDESFAKLVEEHGPLPTGPTVATAGGGCHYYFSHPGQENLGVKIAPGLDLIVNRAYVLAPPTIGPNGRPYEWVVSPFTTPFPPMPEFLVNLGLEKKAKNHRVKVGKKKVSGEQEQPSNDVQSYFSSMWAAVGIELRGGDQLYRCPWHGDANPSLGINSVDCYWHCLGCGVGGGIRELETLVGRTPKPLCRDLYDNTTPLKPSPLRDRDIEGLEWCPSPHPIYRQRAGATTGRSTKAPCRSLACPYCGPRQRRIDATRYATLLEESGAVVNVVVVEDSKWEAFKRKLQRGKHVRVRCPNEGDTSTVFTTMPCGKPVAEDLKLMLLDALTAVPEHEGRTGRNVSSSRGSRVTRPKAPEDLTTFPIKSTEYFDEAARREEVVLETRKTADGSEAVTEVQAPLLDTSEFSGFAALLGIVTRRTQDRRPLRLGARQPGNQDKEG